MLALTLWLLAVLLLAPSALARDAAGGQSMGVVPLRPMPSAGEEWVPGKRATCIDVTRIGGALLIDPETIDVMIRDGRRWRLGLAGQCPQLSYYGGFYFKPSKPGLMCAGRDRVLSRAGGSCRITHIHSLRQVRPQR